MFLSLKKFIIRPSKLQNNSTKHIWWITITLACLRW
jgi:hypothetical protein